MKNYVLLFQDFAPRVVVMYVIALLAFLFYISKVQKGIFQVGICFYNGFMTLV